MKSRRTTELVLLVCAWALGILGTLQVGWATGEGTPPRLWITISAVALIALVMHVVVRVRANFGWMDLKNQGSAPQTSLTRGAPDCDNAPLSKGSSRQINE